MVKLLPEVYFAEMLAGKLSQMHWQWFRIFFHTWITFRTPQNVGTLATKIIAQGMLKLLPEM